LPYGLKGVAFASGDADVVGYSACLVVCDLGIVHRGQDAACPESGIIDEPVDPPKLRAQPSDETGYFGNIAKVERPKVKRTLSAWLDLSRG
jgi:hypothetical protein